MLAGHELTIGFVKFTKIPDLGEMITRKYFKGFCVTIQHPFVYTYQRRAITARLPLLAWKGDITWVKKIRLNRNAIRIW